MSKIITRSLFYYGIKITSSNKYIDFSEGGSELNAEMPIGSYTGEEAAEEMAHQMTVVGALTYTGTFNRLTREITISANGNYELLTDTGSRAGSAVWEILGFNTAADYTGDDTYTGELLAGEAYQTQYPVSKYVSPEDSIVKETGTTNVSATGVTQLIYFYDGARIEMNIRVITNKTGLNSCDPDFYENASGKTDFLNFMRTIMEKGFVEFMPDVDSPNTFYKVILESTKESATGVKFELKNMKTPEFYESGLLTFRKVIES